MNKLKILRIQNRYTQTEVAKASGVSRQAYIKYETGEVEPPLFVLRNLSEFYQVSIEVLTGTDFSKKNDYVIPEVPLLKVCEPASDVSYGDSMYDFISKAVESMSLKNLNRLYKKILDMITVSGKKKMTLSEFEKITELFTSQNTLTQDAQEFINTLRSDREF